MYKNMNRKKKQKNDISSFTINVVLLARRPTCHLKFVSCGSICPAWMMVMAYRDAWIESLSILHARNRKPADLDMFLHSIQPQRSSIIPLEHPQGRARKGTQGHAGIIVRVGVRINVDVFA